MTGYLWLVVVIAGLGMFMGAQMCRARYDSPVLVVVLAKAAVQAGYAIDWARMALRSLDSFLCAWVELRRQTAALPRVWRVIRVKGGDRHGETEGHRRLQRSPAAARVS